MPVPSKIERIVEGDSERTMFSAATVNELIDAINAFLAMEGKGGIRIVKSDAKFVIWNTAVSGSGGTSPSPTTSSVTTINCISRYI